jgi:hypothetical protein
MVVIGAEVCRQSVIIFGALQLFSPSLSHLVGREFRSACPTLRITPIVIPITGFATDGTLASVPLMLSVSGLPTHLALAPIPLMFTVSDLSAALALASIPWVRPQYA